MAGISGYALDAARQIIPQYVTGEGAAAERLQSVERMTMWTAGVIQGAIDEATAAMLDELRRLRAVTTVLKAERDEVKVIVDRMQKNIRPLLATMDDCVSEAMNPPRTG